LFFCRKRKISKKKERERERQKEKEREKLNKGFKTLNNGYFFLEEKEDLTKSDRSSEFNRSAGESSTFFSRTSL
tara:strand:- start:4109 stop:4330 length:222 start_codon:yes stop_codon:yes gene_type:complete